MSEPTINTKAIDEAVLALMWLTLHQTDHASRTARAWKSFDWDTLGRLHAQGLIHDPVGKAKSVVLTGEGQARCKELFQALFGAPASASTGP